MAKKTPEHEPAAPVAAEPANIRAALLVAQSSVDSIAKDARNSFHNYAYVSADGMIGAARAALHVAGLVVRRSRWELASDGCTVASTFETHYPPTGETWTDTVSWPIVVEKGRPVDKAVAGALTTSFGYWLRDLLALPREDDAVSMDRRDDRTAQTERGFRREQAAQREQATRPPARRPDAINERLAAQTPASAPPAPAKAPAPVGKGSDTSEPTVRPAGILRGLSVRRTDDGREFPIAEIVTNGVATQYVAPESAALLWADHVGRSVVPTVQDRGNRMAILHAIEPEGAYDAAELPF